MNTKKYKEIAIFQRASTTVAVLFVIAALAWPAITRAATKLYVYQGVISVAPNSTGLMELGHAGADIATNGVLNVRPGNGGTAIVGPRNTTTDGGRLTLLANAPNMPWHVEVTGASLRFVANTTPVLTIDNTGYTHILGRLCFGSGTGDCASSWDSVAASNQTLEQTLTLGNYSSRPMVLGRGSGTIAAAGIVEANTTSGAFPAALNAVSAKLTSPPSSANIQYGTSVVGINDDNGYAGYFSGRVGIFDTGVTAPTFGTNTVLRVAGQFPYVVSNIFASTLSIDNTDNSGFGAKLTGAVDISGYGSGIVGSNTHPEATLMIDATNNNGFNFGIEGLRVVGAPTTGKALHATAANAVGAGNTTWGVYGEAGNSTWTEDGSFPGNPVAGPSYAGYFGGNGIIEGQLTVKPYGGSMPWGIRFGNSRWAKQHPDLQVCEIGSETCFGKYIYTNGTGRRGIDRTTTQLCYESGGAIVCANMYAAALGCVGGGPATLVTGTPTATSYFTGFNCSGVEFTNAVAPTPNRPASPPVLLCYAPNNSSQNISYLRDNLGCRVASPSGVLTTARVISAPTNETVQILEVR